MDLSGKILIAIEHEHTLINEYVNANEEVCLCLSLLRKLEARRSTFAELLEAKRKEIYDMKKQGYAIDHIDGDLTNFELSNLRIVTRKENLPRKRGQR